LSWWFWLESQRAPSGLLPPFPEVFLAKRAQDSSLLTTTAEGIGSALGQIAARVAQWKRQRTEIEADIKKVIGQAHGMLNEVRHEPQAGTLAENAPVSPRKGGRPKGYKVSDETKAKLRLAWERRKSSGNSHTRLADGRGHIRATDGKRFTARQRGRG